MDEKYMASLNDSRIPDSGAFFVRGQVEHCPFCGSIRLVIRQAIRFISPTFSVQCLNCLATGPCAGIAEPFSGIIQKWNFRWRRKSFAYRFWMIAANYLREIYQWICA
jgi:hypothetical protein